MWSRNAIRLVALNSRRIFQTSLLVAPKISAQSNVSFLSTSSRLLRQDRLFSRVELELRAYQPAVLKSYSWFIETAAKVWWVIIRCHLTSNPYQFSIAGVGCQHLDVREGTWGPQDEKEFAQVGFCSWQAQGSVRDENLLLAHHIGEVDREHQRHLLGVYPKKPSGRSRHEGGLARVEAIAWEHTPVFGQRDWK